MPASNIHLMSRTQFIFGIIFILIVAIVGMITKLVTIGEGIIILLITMVSSPFLFNILKHTSKDDNQ